MLNETANKIFKLKYSQRGGEETWEEACWRVASYIASAEETQDKKEEWEEKFFQLMVNLVFIPGGRILANSGTGIKNLLNCFVLPVEDSRESIYGALKEAAEIFAHGGGIGYNFSNIREEGAPIKTTGGSASGPLSFMTLFDTTGDVIQQASRRGAQMGILDIDHPDIVDFIHYKSTPNLRTERLINEYQRNLKKVGMNADGHKYFQVLEKTLQDDQLSHFNISVAISDKFMQAVENKEEWPLISRYSESPVKSILADELFGMIAQMAWESGDPGVLFTDRANQYNMVSYLGKLNSVNPCLHKDTLLYDNGWLSTISIPGIHYKSWKTGNKECIKLTTNAGHEIILTPDHRIMLKDSTFIEAKDSLGKELAWGLGNSVGEIYTETQIQGFLFGDGYICGGKQGVGVKLNKEKEAEVYNLLLSVAFHEEDNGSLYANKQRLENTLYKSVEFLSYRVYDRIIPNEIMFHNASHVRSFLSGLFEANGSVTKVNQISLKATCREMVKQVQILLGTFGIESWIVTNKPTKIKWDNGEYESRESYNLQIAPRNAYKFKERIGFISDRKNSLIRNLEGIYRSKLLVKSIEDAGVQEVWDFSNKEHYSFANGIIAHNCAEIWLLPYEPCCLGSINLLSFYDKESNSINFEFLEFTVRTSVRFLDNVQTRTEIPIDEINKWSKGLRRIGLGIMGWADLLAELGIPYNSEDAIKLGKYLSWFISYFGWLESIALAEEKGVFPFYDSEKADLTVVEKTLNSEFVPFKINMDDIRKVGFRNVAVTAIAPTGTIALIAGVNSGIEPYFGLAYKRNITEGSGNTAKDFVIEVNPILLEKLSELDLTEKELEEAKKEILKHGTLEGLEKIPKNIKSQFITSHEVNPFEHVDMQAAWQTYVDNSISKTINLPEEITIEEIKDIYRYMFNRGLKGGTVYRNNSKSFQILNLGTK